MADRSEPRLKVLALQRFGLGPMPGQAAPAGDARERLLDEIRSEGAPQPQVSFSGAAPIGRALYAFEDEERAARESRRVAGQPSSEAVQVAAAPPEPGRVQSHLPAPQPAEPPFPQKVYREEVVARVHLALATETGFAERLVQFWSNHFCVSVAKGNFVRAMAGAFEREAIRPNVFGRFEEMLIAVESHPAMLNFLDNQLSIGPDSRAGKRRGRGLNENLAREIMELHTLGVSGGYSQADVTGLARIITGWTIVGRDARLGFPGSFAFNPALHDPGGQKLLGKVYRQEGKEKGMAALADLARHPSAAGFIAHKLARHFVADEPPQALVAELTRVFRETGGDLAALARALAMSDLAWSAPTTKLRTPQEFLIAAFRALGRKPDFGQIAGALGVMGQPLWQPGGPDGYPDSNAAWATPEGIKTRIDVAAQLGRQAAGSVADPRLLVEEVLGPLASPQTRQAVARAESKAQALALLLMSPEFQRR
ncbi:hypothetical protein DK26_09875 [Bosea sp. WAO]|uniref:DUF1800 domain-containing protein n=1 Tax=Bosea sp. WAO TaxID=406341 RepID=UPI00074972B8|nr:DUF1800 family protein [Bosea sp. WAO]KUL95446.1 hypothetical protein DK26_09875 [Bosea sp. WAO]